MSQPIISVENLGKCYRIQHQAERQRYVALRDVIANKARSVVRGLWSRSPFSPASCPLSPATSSRPSSEDFWALRNVSFEIKQGEVVGIIGRNGAGKSTLLKVLSRITEPIEGRVTLRGRVASLLEVGTGFHPELTGRENIFLNGAILGMTRAEIKRKFDEIVAFAEVEKFLDTPVKRYSSGMYVRLAFAVAAHLEPEILVVDEVLAVGDAQFQKKCLGKMQDVAKGGRTVLFVSHNLQAINTLCQKAVFLNKGQVVETGATSVVVDHYMQEGLKGWLSDGTRDLTEAPRSDGSGGVKFHSITLRKRDGAITVAFPFGETIQVELEYLAAVEKQRMVFGFTVKNSDGVAVQTSASDDESGVQFRQAPGRFKISALIQPNYLRSGIYSLQVGCTANGVEVCDVIADAIQFEITDGSAYSKTSIRGLPGIIHIPFEWKTPSFICSEN